MITRNPDTKSGHFCDVLVLLYCGTNGENSPELLGSDESELVIIAWQLLDLQLNQTGDIHYICVQSESDSTQKNKWKEITGISEGVIANAPVFADAIQQFEHAIRNELNEKGRTCSFALCTDGQAHIRQVLMPTSIRDNTQLPEFCYSFFDLKKEFSRCCPDTSPPNAMDCDFQNYTSIEDMLNYLQVNVKEHDTFGVDHVRRMSSVVQLLISTKYGHVFVEPETVTDRLETGPCMTSELINDNTVVRARGLPWQASDHDVARFFKGLNIPRGGAALVLNPQGRRNGEALVRFENSQQRDLALLRHKHHMGNRYIEVYRATSDEFLKVAAGSSCEAIHFLSKEGEAIVRMRGLPFTAVARDIVDFFGDDIPVAHDEGGILLVKYADGRPTGDAFVLFSSEQIAVAALNKHKLTLGKRYVEIFKSTAAEVQQVLSRHMTSPIIPTMPAPAMPLSFVAGGHHMFGPQIIPPQQQAVPIGSVRNCIRLRGMPYSATVEDITLFLGDLACCILPHGIHMVLNQQGRPSGDAFIQLSSVEKCSMAALDVSKGGCHKKHMGERYVEVFQCSGDEMNMVLMGGTLNRNGMLPPPGMEPMPAPPVSVPATFPAHPAPVSAPFILQTPHGALLMHSPLPQSHGIQPTHPIEIIHPHTLFAAAPRTIYQQPAYLPYTPYLPTPPVSPTTPPAMPIQQANQPPIPVQGSGIQVRMQGMPFNAGVTDILSFFKGFNITAESVKLLYNDKLRPTGEALVTFPSLEDSHRAVVENNRKMMGSRYIELLLI